MLKLIKLHLNAMTVGDCIFNIGTLTGLVLLSFGLISCGGGGGGATSASGSTALTISSITPPGIVASSVSRSLTLVGTNFTPGMILSILNSSGVSAGYTVNSSSVNSATVMTVNIIATTAPADNYVMFSLNNASGTPATAVLGVAGSDIRVATGLAIFSPTCSGCHSGSLPDGGLDLSNATLGGSTGVIGISSRGCSSNLRIVPGDPRRTSSVLIDMIKFRADPSVRATLTCNNIPQRQMPPSGTGTALTPTQIQDIVDWVAGGARP